jgi:KDO2-lipid IV(A) lauroyltransferase
MPAYCLREPGGFYTLQMDEPIEFPPEDHPNWEKEVTQTLSRRLEEQIRRRPEQWMWTHRRWKPKPHTMREL